MTINEKLDLILENIGILGKRIDQLGDRLVQLENRLGQLEDRIILLEKRMVQLEDRMVQLEDRMVQLEDRMVQLEDRMVQLEKRMVQLEDRMVQLEDRMVQLEDRMVQLEDRIVQLEDRMVQSEDRINTLADMIAKNHQLLEEFYVRQKEFIQICSTGLPLLMANWKCREIRSPETRLSSRHIIRRALHLLPNRHRLILIFLRSAVSVWTESSSQKLIQNRSNRYSNLRIRLQPEHTGRSPESQPSLCSQLPESERPLRLRVSKLRQTRGAFDHWHYFFNFLHLNHKQQVSFVSHFYSMNQFFQMTYSPFRRRIRKGCCSPILQSHSFDFHITPASSVFNVKIQTGISKTNLSLHLSL